MYKELAPILKSINTLASVDYIELGEFKEANSVFITTEWYSLDDTDAVITLVDKNSQAVKYNTITQLTKTMDTTEGSVRFINNHIENKLYLCVEKNSITQGNLKIYISYK